MVDTKELKVALVRAGLTQKKLAEECEVSNPTITKLFRYGQCDIALAEKVIKILNISNPNEIFFASKIA